MFNFVRFWHDSVARDAIATIRDVSATGRLIEQQQQQQHERMIRRELDKAGGWYAPFVDLMVSLVDQEMFRAGSGPTHAVKVSAWALAPNKASSFRPPFMNTR